MINQKSKNFNLSRKPRSSQFFYHWVCPLNREAFIYSSVSLWLTPAFLLKKRYSHRFGYNKPGACRMPHWYQSTVAKIYPGHWYCWLLRRKHLKNLRGNRKEKSCCHLHHSDKWWKILLPEFWYACLQFLLFWEPGRCKGRWGEDGGQTSKGISRKGLRVTF